MDGLKECTNRKSQGLALWREKMEWELSKNLLGVFSNEGRRGKIFREEVFRGECETRKKGPKTCTNKTQKFFSQTFVDRETAL